MSSRHSTQLRNPLCIALQVCHPAYCVSLENVAVGIASLCDSLMFSLICNTSDMLLGMQHRSWQIFAVTVWPQLRHLNVLAESHSACASHVSSAQSVDYNYMHTEPCVNPTAQ